MLIIVVRRRTLLPVICFRPRYCQATKALNPEPLRPQVLRLSYCPGTCPALEAATASSTSEAATATRGAATSWAAGGGAGASPGQVGGGAAAADDDHRGGHPGLARLSTLELVLEPGPWERRSSSGCSGRRCDDAAGGLEGGDGDDDEGWQGHQPGSARQASRGGSCALPLLPLLLSAHRLPALQHLRLASVACDVCGPGSELDAGQVGHMGE